MKIVGQVIEIRRTVDMNRDFFGGFPQTAARPGGQEITIVIRADIVDMRAVGPIGTVTVHEGSCDQTKIGLLEKERDELRRQLAQERKAVVEAQRIADQMRRERDESRRPTQSVTLDESTMWPSPFTMPITSAADDWLPASRRVPQVGDRVRWYGYQAIVASIIPVSPGRFVVVTDTSVNLGVGTTPADDINVVFAPPLPPSKPAPSATWIPRVGERVRDKKSGNRLGEVVSVDESLREVAVRSGGAAWQREKTFYLFDELKPEKEPKAVGTKPTKMRSESGVGSTVNVISYYDTLMRSFASSFVVGPFAAEPPKPEPKKPNPSRFANLDLDDEETSK